MRDNCAALVMSNLAIYFQTYTTAWSGQHLIARIRIRLFERILNLPLDAFDRWRPGELMSRFSTDLQLMTDADDPHCYTTLSHWDDPNDLERYRKSELFGSVWGRVKTLFAERSQAYSLERFIEL